MRACVGGCRLVRFIGKKIEFCACLMCSIPQHDVCVSITSYAGDIRIEATDVQHTYHAKNAQYTHCRVVLRCSGVWRRGILQPRCGHRVYCAISGSASIIGVSGVMHNVSDVQCPGSFMPAVAI